MKIQTVFFKIFVILLQILNSFQQCRVVKNLNGENNYFCDTIHDLERQTDPYAFNITITNGKLISRSASDVRPSLSVTLSNDVELTNEIIGYVKDISDFWDRRSELSILTQRTFGNLPLKSLRLQDGRISNIEPRTFSQMVDLTELYIVNNFLRIVSNGVFNHLNIETLALSNNRIRMIESDAFADMRNLKHLYLDGNLISSFQSNVFNFKNQLETLHLGSNSIGVIDRNTFKGFDNLRALNLSNNKIDRIINYSFEELLNLETLTLANNFLRDLNPEIFPVNGFVYLFQLSIANNRLTYLRTAVLDKLKDVKHISVMGNPWQCACLNAILTWLGEHNINRVCDSDYFKGVRPTCVAGSINAKTCDYNTNNQGIYQYEQNNQFLRIQDCI